MGHDMQVGRFIPDRALVDFAMDHLMGSEGQRMKFVRQRWEETLAAVSVALGALRDVYPREHDLLLHGTWADMVVCLRNVERTYELLEGMREEMLGEPLVAVLEGVILDMDTLKERLGIVEEIATMSESQPIPEPSFTYMKVNPPKEAAPVVFRGGPLDGIAWDYELANQLVNFRTEDGTEHHYSKPPYGQSISHYLGAESKAKPPEGS
jgi:hypothetical protein